jgi:chromosome segregation protein
MRRRIAPGGRGSDGLSGQAANDAVEAAAPREPGESDRRAAEEAERLVARQLETVVREATWHEAQAERLAAELDRARVAVETHDTDGAAVTTGRGEHEADDAETRTALAAWEARAGELRTRRDRLAEAAAARDASRREAENRRVRAEASTALAEERMARADADVATLGDRERSLAEERDALRGEIAATAAREIAAREALAEIHAADAADRDRLGRAERDAAAARERLRGTDARLRGADHAELEARLGQEALHEAVVVELAGLGEFGIAGLEAAAGVRPGSARIAGALDTRPVDATVERTPAEEDDALSDEAAALEAALALVIPIWAAGPPASPAPSAARLGQLRRRFHELGAVNPYAVDEYAELKTRLETLDAQDTDLRTAIGRTRELIAELDTMIADRFRTTFQALELAFSTRFEQLFGGGFARLSMTDPTDLGTTGIEIVASRRARGAGARHAVRWRAS